VREGDAHNARIMRDNDALSNSDLNSLGFCDEADFKDLADYEESEMAGRSKSPSPKPDYRAELQAKLIEQIQAGTAPWQRTWTPGSSLGLPYNPFSADQGTRKATRGYRGINRLMLMMAGFGDDRWCTFKQGQENGLTVRKGEHGTRIEVWLSFEKADDTSEKKGESLDGTSTMRGVRYFTVFNAQQFENFPPCEHRAPMQEWEAIEKAERVVADSGIPVRHQENTRSPYYSPSLDIIVMPTRGQFPNASAYYDTLFHENVHGTGHPSRLDRDQTGMFGSKSYAREELVAEIGSLFASAEIGIPHNVDRHASYVDNWLEVIREDKNAIPRAASAASAAIDRLMEKEREREVAETQAHTEGVETPVSPEETQAEPIASYDAAELPQLLEAQVA
jgi:putative DNA primase/helicase